MLRTIGRRKLPPEARRIPTSPVGVLDVAAVGEKNKLSTQSDTVKYFLPGQRVVVMGGGRRTSGNGKT